MATRKHASPRRRNPSFRPRSKCVTFNQENRETSLGGFLTARTSALGPCGHAEEEDAADGERLHREGRHEELGGECSARAQAFHRADVFFLRRTQRTLQERQETLFMMLRGRVCICAPVAYQQITGGTPPVCVCVSAVRTNPKAIFLFYVWYTEENDMFWGFVV